MKGLIDEDEVFLLYAHGLTIKEVAEQVGCHTQTVREILEEVLSEALHLGDQADRISVKRRRALETADWSAIEEDYKGWDLTVRELCQKYSICHAALYAFLKRRPDIPKRKVGDGRRNRQRQQYGTRYYRVMPNSRWDAAVEAYKAGMAIREIEAMHGISGPVLYRELTARAIPLRRGLRYSEVFERQRKLLRAELGVTDDDT